MHASSVPHVVIAVHGKMTILVRNAGKTLVWMVKGFGRLKMLEFPVFLWFAPPTPDVLAGISNMSVFCMLKNAGSNSSVLLTSRDVGNSSIFAPRVLFA